MTVPFAFYLPKIIYTTYKYVCIYIHMPLRLTMLSTRTIN